MNMLSFPHLLHVLMPTPPPSHPRVALSCQEAVLGKGIPNIPTVQQVLLQPKVQKFLDKLSLVREAAVSGIDVPEDVIVLLEKVWS